MAAGEYVICFSEKCQKEDVKQYFINCLSRNKFSVTREDFEGKTLLTVAAPFSLLADKVSEPLQLFGFNMWGCVYVLAHSIKK